eukprot:9733700-Lingulodinium_polyedra.AAC.1
MSIVAFKEWFKGQYVANGSVLQGFTGESKVDWLRTHGVYHLSCSEHAEVYDSIVHHNTGHRVCLKMRGKAFTIDESELP